MGWELLDVTAAVVDDRIVAGDVAVRDGRVVAVGVEPAGARGIAVPGLIDLQVNGYGGVDFLTADGDGYHRAGLALASTGVTAFLPTFVSSAPETYRGALAVLAHTGDRGGSPRVLGAHLEGPFLSRRWPGAHDPEFLRDPDLGLADELCGAGPVRMVTLAPELDGALVLIERLTARGVVVSCGHSDADAAVAHEAFDRGARAVTHIYNAHRRWQPRDPGLAGAALTRGDVTVQAIVDDVHLASETAYATFLAARERFCLVTDAIAAAGLEDGPSQLGHRPVEVHDGVVRLADGTLAGSVLTMDRALRNLVAKGASLPEAVHAASRAPALLLRRPDLGRIGEGHPADVAVLDDDLHVVRTFVAGIECASSAPAPAPRVG
jgi:N-acetylglucosamine-6-phosphate deacetylase